MCPLSCVTVVVQTPVQGARGQNPLLSVLPKQVWPEAFWHLWSFSTNYWSIFLITKRQVRILLNCCKFFCRNKNNIHKSWALTRSTYRMVADHTWLWISGWKFNAIIFYTAWKIFKVLCSDIGMLKSVHEDVVLLPTAFSCPEWFFSSPVCHISWLGSLFKGSWQVLKVWASSRRSSQSKAMPNHSYCAVDLLIFITGTNYSI